MADLKQVACEEVDKFAAELNELSQKIWAKPELNFEEHYAHQVLTDFLEAHAFTVERHYKLETAFRATWGEENTGVPHVAILCEYDALPEIGHACGHNLIAELGVAAGLGVKAAMKVAGRPLGKLTVLGTPAEEGGGGKVKLIDQQVFEDVDIALMAHPAPCHDTRFVTLAAMDVLVKYHGKASHAAGFPWEGVNALDAAVMAYQSVSNMRQQFKPTWRVHGVVSKGGTKPNIIPEHTELHYVLRAPTDADLAVMKGKVFRCFEAAAAATGCRVIPMATSPMFCLHARLITNNTLADLYDVNATAVGVNVEKSCGMMTASTDMGNVSHVVPSIQPLYSLNTTAANHQREFTAVAGSPEAQVYTLAQGKALAMTALDVMTSPEVLAEVKADFAKDLQDNA